MFKTVIEVKAFGDFDIMYTMCIMVSTEKMIVQDIIKDFCEMMEIPSIKGLPWNTNFYEMTEEFVTYLELRGFSKLQTTEVYLCD
jgi:hypothetical protein